MDLKISEFLSASKKVDEAVKLKYAVSHEVKREQEETIDVNIPAGKRLKVRLNWKNILQNGFVKLRNQYDDEATIPFSIVVGLTFDQEHVDV